MYGFRIRSTPATLAAALAALVILSGCSSLGLTPTGRDAVADAESPSERLQNSSNTKRFGDAGISLSKILLGDQGNAAAGPGVAVNSYLWRASLDTLSFLPLSSADPFGGVIITDWYAPPEAGDERFKVTVYILDRELRSDGVRAAVFRQTLDSQRGWVDADVSNETAVRLENAILSRARELRVNTAG